MNTSILIPRAALGVLAFISAADRLPEETSPPDRKASVTIRNGGAVTMLRQRDEVVLRWSEIAKALGIPPGTIRAERRLQLLFQGKSVPFQIDRLGGSDDGELVFLLPTNLPPGKSCTLQCRFSPQAKKETDGPSPLRLKSVAGFVRVEAPTFSVVIDAETGGVNRLWLTRPRKILLTRSSRDNWAYSLVGSFTSRDGAMLWKDRLFSGQFRGRLRPVMVGPVRAVIMVDDIRCVAQPTDMKHEGDVSFDDRLRMTHFVYPDGRVVVRLSIHRGENNGDSSYCLIFPHLGVGDAKRSSAESADGNLPFNHLLIGDKNGRIVENRPLLWDKPGWEYDAQKHAPLSFLELAHNGQEQYGVSMIVDPTSYLLKGRAKPTDGAPAWWAKSDISGHWGIVRTNFWFGSFVNLIMSTREWPNELTAPENNIGLEVCYYVWTGRDDTSQVAQRLRNNLSLPGNLKIESLPLTR